MIPMVTKGKRWWVCMEQHSLSLVGSREEEHQRRYHIPDLTSRRDMLNVFSD
jgi:hypothetical protein